MSIVSRHVPYELVEETAHDAFVRAYRSLAGYAGTGEFKSWLAAIAVRTCRDHWRREYRNKEQPMSRLGARHRAWLEKTLSSSGGNPGDAPAEEARELLSWALAHLSPDDRLVLELVYLEGLSSREAARLSGMSVANVKVRAFRAKRKMKKLLDEMTET